MYRQYLLSIPERIARREGLFRVLDWRERTHARHGNRADNVRCAKMCGASVLCGARTVFLLLIPSDDGGYILVTVLTPAGEKTTSRLIRKGLVKVQYQLAQSGQRSVLNRVELLVARRLANFQQLVGILRVGLELGL